jgi:hypothetical protein
MQKTLFALGGRPFNNDDLETIQAEAAASVQAVLAGLGLDCVVSGCSVSGLPGAYSVTPGFVYVGGELLRFLGATGVSLPARLAPGTVTVVQERAYQTGETKACITEQFVELGPAAGGAGLLLYPTGALTLGHALRNQVHELGDIKWGQLVTADFDDTGLGRPGSRAWGWGLCNGQGKRPDLRGRFLAGLDPDNPAHAKVGTTGGAAEVRLTVAEMPAHGHKVKLKVTDSGADVPFTAARQSSNNAKGEYVTTEEAGGSEAHENLPPYYTLAAKMWVGMA